MVLWNPRLRVRSSRDRLTLWPATLTWAFITSPGCTAIRSWVDGAGTSSYHAVEWTAPEFLQSTSVPICSSAFEVTVNPPSPTQYDEKVRTPGVHLAFGWVQVPWMLRNETPDRCMT